MKVIMIPSNLGIQVFITADQVNNLYKFFQEETFRGTHKGTITEREILLIVELACYRLFLEEPIIMVESAILHQARGIMEFIYGPKD